MSKGSGGGSSMIIQNHIVARLMGDIKDGANEWANGTNWYGPFDIAEDMTNSSWSSAMDATWNPYKDAPIPGEAVYDPSTDIIAVESKIAEIETLLASLTPESDSGTWEVISDKAVSLVGESGIFSEGDLQPLMDTAIFKARAEVIDMKSFIPGYVNTVLSDINLEDIVGEFDRINALSKARSINMFAGGMEQIRSVDHSGFSIGLALIEAESLHGSSKYQADQKIELYKTIFTTFAQAHIQAFAENVVEFCKIRIQQRQLRAGYIQFATELMSRLKTAKIQAKISEASIFAESKKMKVALKSDHVDDKVEKYENRTFFALDVYQRVANILAGASGATTPSQRTSKGSGSRLGAAASFGALGAQIGGVTGNPVGAAIGAGIGALIGSFGGY